MIKTVSLTADTETKVEISGGYNVGVINRTTGMLYASRKSGIVAGADDVAAIPAGDSYTIRAADDTVYLLATAAGDVQLESIGAKEVFRIAAARSSSGGGEGGTVDEVARQAISSHANNEDIHLTAEDAIEAAATAISNPNLLINPDFKVNQGGKTEYTEANTYTVDRWKLAPLTLGGTVGKVVLSDSGIALISGGSAADIYFRQLIENGAEFVGQTVTLSLKAESISGEWAMGQFSGTNPSINLNESGIATATFEWVENSSNYYAIQIFNRSADAVINGLEWVKLELGSVATPFIPPDPATELVKSQRYFQRIIHTGDETMTIGEAHPTTSNNLKVVFEHVTAMRATPTVTLSAISDVKYADATTPITDLEALPAPTNFGRNGCLAAGGSPNISTLPGIISTRVFFSGEYVVGHPYIIYLVPGGYIDFSAEL